MCSFSRSISTWPGIRRSPVNSANPPLQYGFGVFRWITDPCVDLYPARQVDVSVDLLLGARHLQCDRVINPVAHVITGEGPVGNRRREGKGRWIQFRKIHM